MRNTPPAGSVRSLYPRAPSPYLTARRKASATPMQAPTARPVPWASLDPALDIATNSQVHSSNEVVPLFNGPEAWPARLQNIANASVILIKTFEFINDSTGRDMVARLRERARAGCRIVIQYDFKGTAEFPRYTVLRSAPKVLWPLRGEPNVLLVPCYIPRHWRYLALPCCHKKYFITFAPNHPATLLMGGMNIADAYCYGGFLRPGKHQVHGYRDTDVSVRGPVVREAVKDFLSDLSARNPTEAPKIAAAVRSIEGFSTYAPTSHTAATRLIVSKPLDKECPHRLPQTFETLLNNVPGGQTVFISNAFFSPPKSTRKALVAAARRGVEIMILNNAASVHDRFGSFMGFIAHGVMRRLIKQCPPGSMRLFEWHSSPADSLCSIHQKITIFGDDGPVWVGSANLDNVSAERNHESVMLVQDDSVRQRFLRQFVHDLQRENIREIDARGFKRESFLKRYIEKVALMIFRTQV